MKSAVTASIVVRRLQTLLPPRLKSNDFINQLKLNWRKRIPYASIVRNSAVIY